MASKNRSWFKGLWITGYRPTQEDFADLFDSFANKLDDVIVKSFTNANQDGSYDLTITVPSSIAFEIAIIKPDGKYMFVSEMARLVTVPGTQIKVSFGEPLPAGTYYYIVKYYTATT